jgi:GTP cyclohydrolase IB
MHDIQSQQDLRQIHLDLVGITNFLLPLKIKFLQRPVQQVTATINFYTNLKDHLKGTHLSRLVELLMNNREKTMTASALKKLVKQAATKLDTNAARFEASFVYFLDKQTPVSKKHQILGYQVKITTTVIDNDFNNEYKLGIPLMTLCPCSKAISKYNAHNQKAHVTLRFNSDKEINIRSIIRAVERQGSAELFPILKRLDEKYITEISYENPKFVEDVVRDVVLGLRKFPEIKGLSVECESFESIHDHNAYAKHQVND